MKLKKRGLLLLVPAILFLVACGTHNLKKDAQKIADAMCRNLEIINKLQTINPNDTLGARALHDEDKALQDEMQKLYKDFREKYGEKTKDPEFSKSFSRELRKAMLNCDYLSKEDRLQLEKEIGK
jgi:hypothetical protein